MDNLLAATMSTWHDEIDAELDAARAELTAAHEGLADAEHAAGVARAERRALSVCLDQQDLAAALVHRRRERDEALRAIEAHPIRQRLGLTVIERRIADLSAALEQIVATTQPGTASVPADPAGIQA